MNTITNWHSQWTLFAVVVLIICLLATIYAFWNKRYVDHGPRKGEAANPTRVRKDNPAD